jgi:5-methylcytosine-specific restriction enzyme subunit McrC
VCFSEFVGVLQVGSLLIEVLPKADRKKSTSETESQEDFWQRMLIGMIRSVYGFEVHTPSSGNLKIKQISILDIYIEMFIKELEFLLNKGLAKKYRKTESNLPVLKGALQFNKHIQQNITHQERFYVSHTTFDAEHQLHFILYKALMLVKNININPSLQSKIGALLLNFPEMPDVKVNEQSFDKIKLNRKTQSYSKALEISRLLLLNYHPDVSKGRNNVLALMFDMNLLWEEFFYVSLRKNPEIQVRKQCYKYFWAPDVGYRRTIRPDIKIEYAGKTFILDTKWKMINNKPSVEDVRQMYAYHHYFRANKVSLVYPGEDNETKGHFVDIDYQNQNTLVECSLKFIEVKDNIKDWKDYICENIVNWIKE